MSKQDLSIKHDPYAATYRGSSSTNDQYLVRSASSNYRYLACIGREDDYASCTCPAHRPCWHIDTARLRREIDRVEANSAALYHTWQLAELADEDERLRAVLAEADSWLVRAQLGVVGDRIAELMQNVEAA